MKFNKMKKQCIHSLLDENKYLYTFISRKAETLQTIFSMPQNQNQTKNLNK